MNIRINKQKLHLFFILLLVYQITFVSFPYFKQNNLIKYMCIIILAFLLFLKFRTIIALRVDVKVLTMILLYLVAVIVSGIFNQGRHVITNPLYGGLLYCLSVFQTMWALLYVSKLESPRMIVKTLYWISLVYVLMNDLLLCINPSMFMKYGAYYFLGNKFAVAYAHIQLVGLYILNNCIQNKKYKSFFKTWGTLIVLCIASIYVSYTVGSITGIIGIVLLILFISVPNSLKNNSIVWLITLISMCAFPVLYEVVLANPYVENFIVNILGKSITLTGRTVIYENIPNLLRDNLILGYGFGSTYEVWMNFMNLPNSQNGLIDCVVEQGLIATILLVILLFRIMRISSISHIKKYSWKPIIAIIYVYTFLSAIEITINITYIFWFLFLYVCSTNSQDNIAKIEI